MESYQCAVRRRHESINLILWAVVILSRSWIGYLLFSLCFAFFCFGCYLCHALGDWNERALLSLLGCFWFLPTTCKTVGAPWTDAPATRLFAIVGLHSSVYTWMSTLHWTCFPWTCEVWSSSSPSSWRYCYWLCIHAFGILVWAMPQCIAVLIYTVCVCVCVRCIFQCFL